MKPTLITGATGFVGWHVARKLLDRGDKIRGLARDPGRFRELEGIEAVQGDLRVRATLDAAVAGCGVVYHVAADYRLWTKQPEEMFHTNVEGTRNLLEAARNAGVERVVYTSTVGCIGVPPDGIGDEGSPVSREEMAGPYKQSKFLAERAALEFASQGLPVVIVNPTAPVGDHDVKPTPTGKIVVDFVRGAMPAFLDTGLNLVDVRDVAGGHLAACERGRTGERYILGAENLTLEQIFLKLGEITGIAAPKIQIPYAVAYAAGLVSTAWAGMSGKEPRAPLDGVRMARKKMWVSQEKAARELGYSPGPAAGALKRAVEWFRANGYC
ncbi:MAG: NAD-dependent epimerase/dehydratase family protein [Bryobacterales bacterium]|nr:NAD-dependent epimerase/dehydratase family protein [Bryobacterales bacterium]MBV9397257.1 NAD-dependent epimerase/dehydratase family protein [Bryobacterales bacterium]